MPNYYAGVSGINHCTFYRNLAISEVIIKEALLVILGAMVTYNGQHVELQSELSGFMFFRPKKLQNKIVNYCKLKLHKLQAKKIKSKICAHNQGKKIPFLNDAHLILYFYFMTSLFVMHFVVWAFHLLLFQTTWTLSWVIQLWIIWRKSSNRWGGWGECKNMWEGRVQIRKEAEGGEV